MDMNEEQNNNQSTIITENVLLNNNNNLSDRENQDSLINYNDILNNNEEKNANGNNGRWGRTEHLRFLGGCLQYGNNWKKVETYVKTRTSTQIRSHAQKYLYKLQKKYSAHNKSIIENNNNNNEINNIATNNENNEELIDIEENNNGAAANNEMNNIEPLAFVRNEEKGNDKKYRLSDEKIKQILEDLTKPNFNIEIVERIILKIFCFHKKYEDILRINPDISNPTKKSYQKLSNSNTNNLKTNNKNIFLCQKLKREPNYEQQIRNMLNSNDQKDLERLFNIFHTGKEEHLYKILMNQLNENE